MKHLSIKARVTLWYTTFMLIFMAVAVFCLLLLSSRISQRHAREILSNVVTDAVRDVHFRYGELDTEDMDFYRDGVSIFIYDTSGYLLAPQINLVNSVVIVKLCQLDDVGKRSVILNSTYRLSVL